MSTSNWVKGWRWLRTAAAALHKAIRGRLAARRALRELELGRRPDGSMVVLDYRSGQLVSRRAGPALAPVQQVVTFAYADMAWLERVVTFGGYAAHIDDDGDLEVRTEAGPVYVRRIESEGTLRCFMRVTDGADAMVAEVPDMLNVLNLKATQGRWVMNDAGVLFMSCDLYAGVGITSAQFLSALRAVSHEVTAVAATLGLHRDTA